MTPQDEACSEFLASIDRLGLEDLVRRLLRHRRFSIKVINAARAGEDAWAKLYREVLDAWEASA